MSEQKNINIRNKRATFDYEILEEYVAGVVFVGTEIKSIPCRPGFDGRFVLLFRPRRALDSRRQYRQYAWDLQQPHAAPHAASCCSTPRELDKLQRAGQDKGLTIVGLRLFLNERGLAKVVVGLPAAARPTTNANT